MEGFVTVAIGLMSEVFASYLGDRDSIPGRIIQKTQKMVLDAALLNTQHYKVRIKDKVEQSLCYLHSYMLRKTRKIQCEMNINETLHTIHVFLNTHQMVMFRE